MATDGWTDAERAAMKERAAELRAEGGRGGAKKADALQALLDKIEEMSGTDRVVAERLHAVVTEHAPDLQPRTWYGMPAYANAQGKVVVFFQPAEKFEARYATIGFQDEARLDDGDMWPVTYAVIAWTDAVEARVVELVRTAVG
jgi:uncharacterized protein YdhG (YjbR/CyaY superfamily)